MRTRSSFRGVPATLGVLCSVAAGLVAACGPDSPPSEDSASRADQAIVNGQVESGREFVGTSSHCSAVLVGARTALTAAHCVDRGERSFSAGTGPWLEFTSNDTEKSSRASRTVTYPNYQGENDWRNDLAVVSLERAPHEQPVPMAWTTIDETRDISLVGFGCTKDGDAMSGERRSGTNGVLTAGNLLLTYETDRAQSCSGDSGGAALQSAHGLEYLYGVIVGHSKDILGETSYAHAIQGDRAWITAQMERNFDVGARTDPACGKLRGHEGFVRDLYLATCNGLSTLEIASDGALVLYRSGGNRVWDSRALGGLSGYSAHMQRDGNFVLYDENGIAKWSTGTSNHPGSELRLQNDGNLVVYDSGGRALWATNTVIPKPNRCGVMRLEQGLGRENTLSSCNGFHTLRMQNDGNLVLYDVAARATWSTSTAGSSGYFATLQVDGNFVLYNLSEAALWSTGTYGRGADHLSLQNDGNLVVYSAGGQVLWTTNTYLPGPSGTRFLRKDEALTVGRNLTSRDGFVDLRLQSDGNLVLYNGGRALWASNTYGKSSYLATVQPDGNFVLYDRADAALWASGTPGSGDTYLAVQNDGNLVVYSANDIPLWASHTRLPKPSRCGFMYANELLFGGEQLWSCNGRYFLEMQTDGNLVLYTMSRRALWSSGTYGSTAYISVMQPDGNFVVYDLFDQALTSTGTYGRPGAYLAVQDDGNLVVYSTDGVARWASGTWSKDRLEGR